jgi:hypothetical protein
MTGADHPTAHPITSFTNSRSPSTFRIIAPLWEGTDRYFSGLQPTSKAAAEVATSRRRLRP